MVIIKCPLCEDVILTSDGRRENCSDIWYELNDGSKMPAMICTNCLISFTRKKADGIFTNTKNQWKANLRINPATKDSHIFRLDKLEYVRVFDRSGDIIIKE